MQSAGVNNKIYTQKDLDWARKVVTIKQDQMDRSYGKWQKYESEADKRYYESAKQGYEQAVEAVQIISRALLSQKK